MAEDIAVVISWVVRIGFPGIRATVRGMSIRMETAVSHWSIFRLVEVRLQVLRRYSLSDVDIG